MKAFLFPGQGAQEIGMGKDWYDRFPEAKATFEEACEATGLDMIRLCFSGGRDELDMTELTQPAILTTCVAIWRSLLVHTGLADMLRGGAVFAGHSLGEYSALVCSGVLDFKEAVRTVRYRGKFMQQAVPLGKGGMAALLFKPGTPNSDQLTLQLCEWVFKETGKRVEPANFNSDEQVVVAGEKDAILYLTTKATPKDFPVRRILPLQVSAPFHSSMMKPAAQKLLPQLKELSVRPMKAFYYVPNVEPKIVDLGTAGEDIKDRLVKQIYGSVYWTQTMRLLLKNNDIKVEQAFEIGPGSVLCGLSKRISVDGQTMPCTSISTVEGIHSGGDIHL
ncbi:MAG TPA: ACP S-malonyltransferase [Bdellovibrionota bacterium]|jgi:[acyl-carrier-protein] S-malonyltransferase|nr:ACP S-malonyltransferase [Bdellovibrionota bacterium]